MTKLGIGRSLLVVLALVNGGCIGGGKETECFIPPTSDYSPLVSSVCQSYFDDLNESGLLTSNLTPRDKQIIFSTCVDGLNEEIPFGWPDENAFRVAQDIVVKTDEAGSRINDWRGHNIAKILASNIRDAKVPPTLK